MKANLVFLVCILALTPFIAHAVVDTEVAEVEVSEDTSLQTAADASLDSAMEDFEDASLDLDTLEKDADQVPHSLAALVAANKDLKSKKAAYSTAVKAYMKDQTAANKARTTSTLAAYNRALKAQKSALTQHQAAVRVASQQHARKAQAAKVEGEVKAAKVQGEVKAAKTNAAQAAKVKEEVRATKTKAQSKPAAAKPNVVAAKPTAAAIPTAEFEGCYKDAPRRAIPYKQGRVGGFFVTGSVKSPKDQCFDLAVKAGHDTFGLQNGNECWTGLDSDYEKYGKEMDPKKCGKLGGPYTNQVYFIKNLPKKGKTAVKKGFKAK